MMPARVTVIGAGLMGHGLAQIFALAGHQVVVQDPYQPSLDSLRERIAANLRDLGQDESAVTRVRAEPDLARAVSEADYVLEAAVENLEIKQQIFAAIEAACPADCILASNTSVIPITAIMGGLRNRSRALGTHWWNPPFLVPLVEVIQTEWTAPSVIDWTMKLHTALGKTPVHVKKDVPGFIGNRLQHALWREAISIVERGIADAETVDAVIRASIGRRLSVLAPLANSDLVGTELTLAIHRTVLPDIENSQAPSPLLERMIEQGKLGFKSGEGFMTWSPEQQSAIRQKMVQHLKAQAADDPAPSGAVAAWTRG